MTVKASAGKVFAVRAGAGVNVTLKDNATERWYVAAGEKDSFIQPVTCWTSIVLNFSAAVGDKVEVWSSVPLQGIILTGWVSATDTVTVQLYNPTAAAIDLPVGNYYIKVTK